MRESISVSLFHFPKYWYVDTPAWWFRFLLRLLIYFDNQLAIRLMVRFWLVPVWQDTTYIGRSLSLIFRTIRVIIGIIIELMVFLGMFFWLVIWLVLPLLLVIKAPYALILLFILWIIDALFDYLSRERNSFNYLLNSAQGDVARLKDLLLANPQVRLIVDLIELDSFSDKPLTVSVEELVRSAKNEQQELSQPKLLVEHLFLALLRELKFHYQEARHAQDWIYRKKNWSRKPWIWQDDYLIRPIGGINRTWTGIITPELDRVSTDLTQLAAQGKLQELIGRRELVQEIVETLGKEGRDNVLIVGESGSGKTTLVEGFANEIIRGTQYQSLQFKRLICLDIAALTAGTTAVIKERLVTIIEEIKQAGNVILFIDEIHNFVAAEENQNSSVVFTALEPHLDAGEFQFIATTTPAGFKRFLEPSEAFVRTFRTVNIEPASKEETLEIAKWKAYELEHLYNIKFTYLALEESIELARRYIHARVLPDSAINLLEEVANKSKLETQTRISQKEIEEMVTELTQIPVRTVDSKQESHLLLNLEQSLHQRVIGQEKAIEEVADALRRARTGMSEEGKLLASFLFAGPTGVGKTETAKALAEVYFGSEKAMVRVDMSEYQAADSINRLIGPPPGMPGYELGGQLTEAVRRRPFTVLLLDEIEKANKRILDVFLQLLDDARLTDGSGRTVDFANTIIIATSNVGTKTLIDGVEAGRPFDQLETEALELLRDFFRPEFLNRFTDTIIFKPLSREQVGQIAHLILGKLQKKMAEKELKLEFTPELIDLLARKGYNPLWGARELKRVIRDEIEEKIAKKILQGEIKPEKTFLVTPEILNQ